MKIVLLFIPLFAFASNTLGQNYMRSDSASKCIELIDDYTNSKVFTVVNSPPEFSDGQLGFLKFFANNFVLPKQSENILLSFNFEFIIDKDGKVFGERIQGKKRSELTTSEIEALRVISIMPKWIPGKCDFKTVPVKVKLPIKL